MAYGDINYEWIASGSTATSADTASNLFGVYQGLSDLNNAEAVHIQLQCEGSTLRFAPSAVITNNTGFKLSPTASWIDLPPMRANNANELQIINHLAGNNASVNWVIWRRVPL
jgi:hypothetical protein